MGFLGSIGSLTPLSAPGSGLAGAGNVPATGSWSWTPAGLRSDITNCVFAGGISGDTFLAAPGTIGHVER